MFVPVFLRSDGVFFYVFSDEGFFFLQCSSLLVVNLAVSLPFDCFPGFTKLVFG